MTVTEKLARFVVDTSYDDLPRKTVNYAKELALSNLGSMVWGSTLPAGKIVIKFVKEMGGTQKPASLVVGSKPRRRMPP